MALIDLMGILDNYDSGSYHLDGTLIKDLTEKQAAESACYSPILKKSPLQTIQLFTVFSPFSGFYSDLNQGSKLFQLLSPRFMLFQRLFQLMLSSG